MTMRNRPAVRELALFALFTALAVALTWPLAANLGTALSDLGDPLLNTWIIDWDLYAFAHQPLHLFDAPMYAPAKYPLAYSENMVAIALLMAPFRALGVTPITLYNLAMLLGFAMSGYGMSVLVRTCGRSTLASFIAGVLFAFCGFKLDHLAHIQIIWSGWLPLLLAALLSYWRVPSTGRAAALAGAFVFNGLTNIHWLLFGSFALVVTIGFLAAAEPRRGLQFWGRLAAALIVGSLVLVPFLLPYSAVAKLYGMRRIQNEVAAGSAVWSDWRLGSDRLRLYGSLWSEVYRPERRLFPGAVALLLAAVAMAKRRSTNVAAVDEPAPRRRTRMLLVHALDALAVVFALEAFLGSLPNGYTLRMAGRLIVSINNAVTPLGILTIILLARCAIDLPPLLGGGSDRSVRFLVARSRLTAEEWSAGIWIVLGVIGSLGLNFYFHSFLFAHVGAFQSIRTPARWAILAYVGIGVLAAAGVDILVRQTKRAPWRMTLQAVLVVFAVADVMPKIRWEQQVPERSPVYAWLAHQRISGSVLELPMTGWNLPFPYLLASTIHHVPIMNGTSGFEPPVHRALRTMTQAGEFDSLLTMTLENNGCQLVIVHPDWFFDNVKPVYTWIRSEMASGHLGFVRRFDGGIYGDYLFALPATTPEWQRLRPAAHRDAAGFTDDENLQRLLNGMMTYSSTLFGRIESPEHMSEVRGPLKVRGWALSPDGISRVIVRIHAGTRRFEAALELRPDISASFPWYPKTPKPGFVLELRRPRGVPRDTDVQVEIHDGAGKVTRLPDRTVHWD